jgi:hypothetical protein
MRGCLRNCKLRGSAPRQQEQEQLQLQPIRHTARVTSAAAASPFISTFESHQLCPPSRCCHGTNSALSLYVRTVLDCTQVPHCL